VKRIAHNSGGQALNGPTRYNFRVKAPSWKIEPSTRI